MIYHIEQNGIQTQAYRRLGCRPDWTNDPGFTRRQKSDTMSFAATSISKKNSIFVVKRLEIYSIQPRFAVSPFLRSNHSCCCSSCRADPRHCFNRGLLHSMSGTSHIEVASHPSQQEIRNFNGGRYTMKRISKSLVHGAIAQPTLFKLCRMVQTYMLGMEPQGLMS